MPDQEPNSHFGDTGEAAGTGRLAAFIYGGVSFVAALIFWLVTTFTSSYPAVARYGGAVWVFVLMMIVLMPIIIPRVSRWRRGTGVNPREGASAA